MQDKKGSMRTMVARRLPFHLIEGPMGVSSPHTHLVVNVREVPPRWGYLIREHILSRDSGGQILAPHTIFTALLITGTRTELTTCFTPPMSPCCDTILSLVRAKGHLRLAPPLSW